MKMIDAYRLLSETVDYPLHLGVTEAGPPPAGLVKSTAGIGTLLAEGIGDTIRFSLTADPVEEAKAGRTLLEALGLRERSTGGRKAFAREAVRAALRGGLQACVRINVAVSEAGTADLAMLAECPPRSVMLPKVSGPRDLDAVHMEIGEAGVELRRGMPRQEAGFESRIVDRRGLAQHGDPWSRQRVVETLRAIEQQRDPHKLVEGLECEHRELAVDERRIANESSRQRRRLPVVAFQTQHADAGIFFCNFRQHLRRRVRALIVHIYEFDGLKVPAHHLAQPMVQFAHAVLLVVKWDYN